MTLRMAVTEISWLVRLLGDLGLTISGPVSLFYDNQAALHIAKNTVFHERTKHIEVDCPFFRDSFNSGLISLFYVCSLLSLPTC